LLEAEMYFSQVWS